MDVGYGNACVIDSVCAPVTSGSSTPAESGEGEVGRRGGDSGAERRGEGTQEEIKGSEMEGEGESKCDFYSLSQLRFT